MVRGLLRKLAKSSISVAGKWQQQQLRRLNIHEYQGAELMSKYGINVPNGVAISSLQEAKEALNTAFSNDSEVVVKSQILAGGRGLGTFKNGLKGGVHIVKAEEVEEKAGALCCCLQPLQENLSLLIAEREQMEDHDEAAATDERKSLSNVWRGSQPIISISVVWL